MAITDLTGTTWLINSTACPPGYGQFNINFNLKDGDFNPYNFFHIGFRIGAGDEVSRANSIAISVAPEHLDVGDVITITGGTDATSQSANFSSLLAWLTDNATQITISDLSGTTWVFNDVIYGLSGGYNINFTSNNTNYNVLACYPQLHSATLLYGENEAGYGLGEMDSGGPNINTWYNNAYKTISITGGTDATNINFIAWLQANATQQVSSIATITYNGSTLYAFDDVGTKTLNCSSKRMASDVVINATDLTDKRLTATYNNNTIVNISTADTKTLSCNGLIMATDVVVTISSALPQLTAPRIELEGAPSGYTVTFTKGSNCYDTYDSYRQYSLDGTTWNNITYAMNGTTLSNVTSIYFKTSGNGYNRGTLSWTNPTGSIDFTAFDYSSTLTSGEITLTGNMVVTYSNTNEPE